MISQVFIVLSVVLFAVNAADTSYCDKVLQNKSPDTTSSGCTQALMSRADIAGTIMQQTQDCMKTLCLCQGGTFDGNRMSCTGNTNVCSKTDCSKKNFICNLVTMRDVVKKVPECAVEAAAYSNLTLAKKECIEELCSSSSECTAAQGDASCTVTAADLASAPSATTSAPSSSQTPPTVTSSSTKVAFCLNVATTYNSKVVVATSFASYSSACNQAMTSFAAMKSIDTYYKPCVNQSCQCLGGKLDASTYDCSIPVASCQQSKCKADLRKCKSNAYLSTMGNYQTECSAEIAVLKSQSTVIISAEKNDCLSVECSMSDCQPTEMTAACEGTYAGSTVTTTTTPSSTTPSPKTPTSTSTPTPVKANSTTNNPAVCSTYGTEALLTSYTARQAAAASKCDMTTTEGITVAASLQQCRSQACSCAGGIITNGVCSKSSDCDGTCLHAMTLCITAAQKQYLNIPGCSDYGNFLLNDQDGMTVCKRQMCNVVPSCTSGQYEFMCGSTAGGVQGTITNSAHTNFIGLWFGVVLLTMLSLF